MRIVFLVHMMSGRGGTESAILGLVRGLQSLGDEPHVYLLGGAPSDPLWLEQIPHTILGSSQLNRLRRFREYSFGLAKEFRRFRPDVVVALDGPRLLNAWVALALSGHRAQVWSWIHFPVERIKMRGMLKHADGHLAISEGVARQLRAFVGARKNDRVVTIYNPIETNLSITPRPSSAAPAVFLHIGRLEWDRQKRVNDLLTAAARLKGEFNVVIVGEGNDRSRLEQYSSELGLDGRIDWIGWKSDPWAAVKEASVLVLTSSFEGFAIVLAEALAHGVPCISSDCKVGPDEIVEEGISGWFYPVGDIEALAQRMQQIVDNPDILPEAEALRVSAQKFSVQAVAERAHKAFAQRSR
jgi:UDP-D-galactose:(glucosyl)LPS alpha-1,6-D-galactosyltransferase